MNTNPETDLDLEKLFLPAWAQEPASVNRYAKFAGDDSSGRDDRRRDDRRGPFRPGGPRREGPGRGFGRARGDERPRPPRRDAGDRKFSGEERGRPRFGERRERQEPPPPPLPEISVSLVPEEKGVESLARQIKMTGRAYPLFQIAQLILSKPERYTVRFAVEKGADGQPAQPLFLCALDDTLWLTGDECIEHVLKNHFATFYQAERTATEPPKGRYTFVAQCGLSGTILGPPNYHDYQNRLHKLHAERFAQMPFEVYKSRVKIVRDPEVVKKWVEEQSWKIDYVCLNLPEPLRLGSREEVQRHFREVHTETIIKPVEAHTLAGSAGRAMRCPGLARLVRSVWEDQRRFPLQIATVLSQQFAAHGLQFFKVNRTVTHVSVARPHFLDLETTPVSNGIKCIVDYINAKPKCTRRQLVEALAPSPVTPTATAPAAAVPEGEATAATAPQHPESAGPTPEQTAVIADLHWLIHQGHVIEFADGVLDVARKPALRPAKPEVKPAEADSKPAAEAQPTAESEQAAPGEAPSSGEAAPQVPAESVSVEAMQTQTGGDVSSETPEAEPVAIAADPPAGGTPPAAGQSD